MKTYKAFNQDLQCLGFQFSIDKLHSHIGEIVLCSSGFHSCENPIDVLNFYPLISSRFAICEASGIIQSDKSSKIVSSELILIKELSFKEFIIECGEYSNSKVNYLSESGNNSKFYECGNYAMLSTAGSHSSLCTEGVSSNQASFGHDNQLIATGNKSKITSTGSYNKLCALGVSSSLMSSGKNNTLVASDDCSQLAALGEFGQIGISGNSSSAIASGYSTKLISTGNGSKLATLGDSNILSALGENSLAASMGINGKVKGGLKCALALTYKELDGSYKIVVAYVGENGIESDTWYKLDEMHSFIKC